MSQWVKREDLSSNAQNPCDVRKSDQYLQPQCCCGRKEGRSRRRSKVDGKVSLAYAVPNSRRWNLSQKISKVRTNV